MSEPMATQNRSEKEKLASWMIMNGFATGHGDTLDDLLFELTWQVREIRNALGHREDLEVARRATSSLPRPSQ